MIKAVSKPRILVIGDVMLDIYTKGSVDRISPEAPVPVVKVEGETYRLGGAASVAAYAKRLLPDALVALRSAVSPDSDGKTLRRLLCDACVDARCSEALSRCTIKRRYVDHNGRHVMRADQEHGTPLGRIRETMLSAGVLALAKEAWDIVLIADYNKGVCQPEILARLVPELKAGGAKIIVDPALGADPLKYDEPFCIIPNRREAAGIVGDVICQPSLAASRIRKLAGAEWCLLKLDRDGGELAGRQESIKLPALARHVADVTGAGDMVLAAVGASLASGLSMPAAAYHAIAAAALHVEGFYAFDLSGARERVRQHFTGANGVPAVTHQAVTHQTELAANIAAGARNHGLRVVFTNGCFDLFHGGHLRVLKEARQQGELLIVAINSDESVRRLKGDRRPVRPLSERIAIVKALGIADLIVWLEADTPLELIEAIRPDVLVKGADTVPPIPGADLLRQWGGRLHLASVVPGVSTSKILRGISARPA